MKATKKVISVFLAILMTVSCLTAALPSISFAAASAAQWSALKTAVTAAGTSLKTANYTKSGSTSSTSRTITDNTSNSAVYNVILKLYDCINGEMGKTATASYNYPSSLVSRMKSQMSSQLTTSVYTGNAKTALDDLVTFIISNSNVQYTSASKYTAKKNFSYPSSIADVADVTVTVKRSRDAAIMSYSSITSVPATVETSFSMKLTVSKYERKWTSGFLGAVHNLEAYSYFSAMSKTANVTTSATNISLLKTYLNYFTKTLIAKDPYTAYSFETLSDLNSLIADNTAQQNALASAVSSGKLSDTVVQYFAKKQYSATTDVVDDWCKECSSAAVYFTYKDKVDWLMANVMPMQEDKLNALDYSYMDVEEVRALLSTAASYYSYLENTVKNTYATAYGRYVDEGYDASSLGIKIDAMQYYVDCYDLAALKSEMDAYMAQYPDCKVLDDATLTEVHAKMSGYISTIYSYDADVIAAVFPEGEQYAVAFRDDCFVEITYREAKSVFADYAFYYDPLMNNINNGKSYIYSTDDIRTMIQEGTAKYNEYLTVYNNYRKTLPADYMSAFDDYGDEIKAYLDKLPRVLVDVLTDEVDTAIELAGGWTAVNSGKVTVTLANFAAIKAAVNAVEDDVYAYLNDNFPSLLTSTLKTRYAKLESLLVLVQNFEDNFLNNFKKVSYDNASGVYTVRSVYAGDLARVEGEDYTVTDKSLETLINKLDDFVGSSEFTDLLGQIMENGDGDSMFTDENGNVMNLTQFVDKMLVDNLYNDQTITAVMEMFYPMVYKEVTNLINNLLEQYNPLDLNTLTGGQVSGTLYLTYNGKDGSSTFEQLYSMLGLSITPKALAATSGMSAYPTVRAALNASSNNWDKVVWDNMVWNVKDYNTFISALAACLDGIKPLLQILLCDSTQTKTLTNAAHVDGNVKYSFISVGLTGLVSADLTIGGYTGYKDIVIPVYEALGLADYNFAVPSASASTRTILDSVFKPLLTLVDRVTADPLNTVLAILPNITYGMITDRLTELLNFNLNIHYELSLDLDDVSGIGAIWNTIKQWIVNAVASNLKGDVALNVKDDIIGGSLANMIKIDGVPFNYTDLNWIVNYLISDMFGATLNLPLINAGNIITASTLNKSASSKRTSGKRVNFTTDKADLFWVIWNYLCSAVGDEAFASQLYNMISPNEDGSVAEVPEMLAQVFRNLGDHPDQALAAVNELFVPQTYAMKPYEWYTNDEAATDGIAAGDFAYAYLYYTNDWTDGKAIAMVESIDDVVEAVLRDNGMIAENESFGDWLNASVNSLFNNDLITVLMKVFAENFASLGTGAVGAIIKKQFGADLSIWAVQYGELFGVDTSEFTDKSYAASRLGNLTAQTVEPTEENKNGIVWSYNGSALTDGDRDAFLDILTYAVRELAPITNLILCGDDVSLFGSALTIKGYTSYDAAVIPLAEALGITDVLSQDEYIAAYRSDSVAGLNYVIHTIFSALDSMTAGDFIYNVLDRVPNILYFLQSGGLSSFLMNFLKPLLVLLDTARPIFDLDVNGLLQDLIDGEAANLNSEYDPEDETRFMIDVRDVDMNAAYAIAEAFTGLEVSDALQYALEGLFYTCTVSETASKSAFLGFKRSVPGFSAASRMEGKTQDEIQAMSRADSLTVLLSLVLDLVKYDGNAAKIDAMIGEDSDIVQTIVSLLNYESDTAPMNIDWYYFADGVEDDESFAEFIQKSYVPGDTISYLKYAYGDDNSWTEASASYMSANLTRLIDMIIASATDSDNLNEILTAEFDKANLYTQYNIDAFGQMIGELLKNVPDVYANLLGIVLNLDLDAYKAYVPDDADKAVVLSKEDFAAGLAGVLAPISDALDWLLLGKDYKFFYGKNGKDAIVLAGSNGYETGLVPVLEALAVANLPAADSVANSTELAEKVILAALDKIETVVHPADGDSSLQIMLDHLPNIIYFLNANGLTAAVNNLLKGVTDLIAAAEPLTGLSADLNTLVGELLKDSGIALDVNDLDFGAVAGILKDTLGLDIESAVVAELTDEETGKSFTYNYLSDLYIGEVVKCASVSPLGCYRMVNTDETQRDVLTVILCAALDVFRYPDNKDTLVGWMGEDMYQGILNILTMEADSSYKTIDWLFTDGNGEILKEYVNEIFSPLRNKTGNFDYGYDEYWTREKAMYVADNLNDFINGLMKLLGIQINGVTFDDIGDVVNQLVGESLYTNENAAKVAKLLADNIAKLLAADPSGEGVLAEVIYQLLGVDLTVYEKYASGSYDFGIETGNRQQFTAALVEILMPLEPVLKWLLTDKDINLLVDKNGGNSVTLDGGEGYKYGVIPILEALDRSNPSIRTAEQYYADVESNPEAMVTDIVDPVLDFLDYVLEDPLNNLLEVLPGIIYFIDSKGLDASFKNLVRPVTDILEAIEPMTGEINLYDALGFNLETLDFDYIFRMLIEKIAAGTGEELAPLAGNAVSELTMGKLVPFTSKAAAGDASYPTAYTMEYVEGEMSLAGKADMLTVVLRLALKWITLPENQDTIRTLIRDNVPDETTCEYVLGTYDTLVKYLDQPHGINMMLGVVYYIFYGLDIAVDETNKWFDDTNGKWQFIMGLFDSAESDYLSNFGESLKELFKVTDGVIDEDGVASSGLVPFFQKIVDWFKKIIQWIKDLFNKN